MTLKNSKKFFQLCDEIAKGNHQQSKTDNLDAEEIRNFNMLLSTVGEKLDRKISVFSENQNF